MLHSIINELGDCFDLRDDISAKSPRFSHVCLLISNLWCLNLRNYIHC